MRWLGPQRLRGTLWGLVALWAVAGAGTLQPVLAAGETHALLMWVGRYGAPELNLPGIDVDAARAREIATALGVRPARRIEVSEEALTLQGLVAAFETLERRVRPGDRVFVYFSGHGKQIDGRPYGARCSEGIVTQDAALYLDVALERTLQRLGARAERVLMLNDSCHAGGAATKRWAPDAEGEVPKFFPAAVRAAALPAGERACGEAVNKSLGDLLAPRGGESARRNALYVAAAAADEIAYAGPAGSRATAAWHACLTGAGQEPAPGRAPERAPGRAVGGAAGGAAGGPAAGAAAAAWPATGEALRRCAQRLVDQAPGRRQTITLTGDPAWEFWGR